MTAKRETRNGEVRQVGEGEAQGTFEVLAVAYDVVDDYGTRFVKGCFADSLEERLPVIAWAHSWADPIGRATGYRDADEGLYLTARLDVGQGIGRADQALAQLRSGTLTDVSVGFMRLADRTADDGVEEIVKAELDEVSVVLRGAVPGAAVMAGSVRDARGQVVPEAELINLAKRVADPNDDLTVDEAKAALAILATDDSPSGGGDGAGTDPPPEDPPPLTDADQAVLAEAEQIIDDIGRSR